MYFSNEGELQKIHPSQIATSIIHPYHQQQCIHHHNLHKIIYASTIPIRHYQQIQ